MQSLVKEKLDRGDHVTPEEYSACFTDYDLVHADLQVQILNSAQLVEYDNGRKTLDNYKSSELRKNLKNEM